MYYKSTPNIRLHIISRLLSRLPNCSRRTLKSSSKSTEQVDRHTLVLVCKFIRSFFGQTSLRDEGDMPVYPNAQDPDGRIPAADEWTGGEV